MQTLKEKLQIALQVEEAKERGEILPLEMLLEDKWIHTNISALERICCGYEIRIKPPVEKWAAEKKAFAEGKNIQIMGYKGEWKDCEPQWASNREYRIAPELEYIALCADDVPPGSVMRPCGWTKGFVNFEAVVTKGIRPILKEWGESVTTLGYLSWLELFDEWKIKRPGEDWKPCRKVKEEAK